MSETITLLEQREVKMQAKAVPLTGIELPKDTLQAKRFGTFPTQQAINNATEDDPEWKKKCIIEADERSRQIDITPFVISILTRPGLPATVYPEDLDIKLIITFFDPVAQEVKYREAPPDVAANYYWEIDTASKVIGSRYTACHFLRSKHYNTAQGIEFFIAGGSTPITPVG